MTERTRREGPHRLLFAAGIVMVVLAVAGYLTVADDFRHVGELAGVSALLVAGLALVGDAYHVMAHWLSLRWIAVGVVAGTAIGGAADVTATGFVAGVAAGAVLALIRARSVEPV